MRLHAVLLILGHSEWGCVLEFYIKPALEEYPVAIKNRKEKPFETAVDESKWAGFFLYIFFFFFKFRTRSITNNWAEVPGSCQRRHGRPVLLSSAMFLVHSL